MGRIHGGLDGRSLGHSDYGLVCRTAADIPYPLRGGGFVKRVLVVEDDAGIQDMLRFVLEAAEFEYLGAGDIQEAYWQITDDLPDIVLLDWMLPGGSGIELLQKIRRDEATKSLPVIMLTAKVHEDNIIQGLDMGAHDYITKPFSARELIARISGVLRNRESREGRSECSVGDLILEVDSRRVMLASKVLELGPTEFRLLHLFMTYPERAFTRAQILDRIWGGDIYVQERTVDVHIRRLRKILEVENPSYSDLIQTVHGTGYRFSPRDLAASAHR